MYTIIFDLRISGSNPDVQFFPGLSSGFDVTLTKSETTKATR